MFTKEEYKEFQAEYDRVGAALDDAKEDGSSAEKVDSLRKELKVLGDKIHSYEREYEYEEKNEAEKPKFKPHRYTYFKGYKKLKHVKLFESFVNEFTDGPSPKLDQTFKDLEKWLKATSGEYEFGDLESAMSDESDDFITLGMDKKESTIEFDNNSEWIGIAKVKFNGDKIVLPAEWIDAKAPAHMQEAETAEPRKLSDIAAEISADWKSVNYAAKPYLEAMHDCDTIDGSYGEDSCASVVAYFLSNAAQWKGEKAKAIKKELNTMLKKYYGK